MNRTSLLLADVPAMLSDIIGMLAEEPRMRIVARVGPGTDLDEALDESGADVVLMSERMDRTGPNGSFLLRHPGVRVLTLSARGDRLRVRELVPREAVLTDMSPQDLIDAILGRIPDEG